MKDNFSKLWVSVGLSNLGDGFLLASIPLAALSLTNSPLLISIIAATMPASAAIGGMYITTFTDKLDRGKVLVSVNIIRMVLMIILTLFFITRFNQIALLIACLIILGLLEIVFDSTYLAVIPTLVQDNRLDDANSKLQFTQNIANDLLGPTLVAALIGLGLHIVFGVSAALYFVAGGFIFLLVINQASTQPPERQLPYWQSIKETLAYIRTQREVLLLLLASIAMNIAVGAFGPVYVIYVVEENLLSKQQFSLLLTALSVGALVGVVVMRWLPSQMPRLFRLTFSALLMTISTYITLVLPVFWGLYAGGVLAGVAILMWNTLHNTLRQKIIPNHLLVRVYATLKSIAIILLPLGAFLGGAIAQATSVRTLYTIICIYQLLITLALAIWSVIALQHKNEILL